MYYIQSCRCQVLLIVSLFSGIVNVTYMKPSLQGQTVLLRVPLPNGNFSYAIPILFIGLGIYNFDYIPVLEINQVDVWRGLRMFHDCTDIATFFKGKYILGCLLSSVIIDLLIQYCLALVCNIILKLNQKICFLGKYFEISNMNIYCLSEGLEQT